MEHGKAVFVSDDQVAPVTLALLPGTEFHQLWGADSACAFPDDGARPRRAGVLPAAGRVPVRLLHHPARRGAGAPADLDIEAALAEFDEKLPGMAQHLEPADPGMHTTASIDYGVVLAGQAILELDDGAKLALNAGDTYIQNGTRHRWSNVGDVPAVLAVALIGARHADVG